MKERMATADWRGDLENGEGQIEFGNGRFNEPYSADSRFADGQQTNPEELIAAAHAGCYSMALSGALTETGKKPVNIHTEATARLEKQGDGFAISSIVLKTKAEVPDISGDEFNKIAENAKDNCPVSKALAGCNIQLEAQLI